MPTPKIQVKSEKNLFFIHPVETELINVANQYLEGLKIRGCSILTIRAYAFDLLYLIRWLNMQKKDFAKITDRDVFEWIEFMRGKDSSPASINRRLNSCYSFFSYCYGEPIPRSAHVPYGRQNKKYQATKKSQGLGEFWRKPKHQLKVKEPRRLTDPLTVDEVKKFLSHTSRYRDIAIILLMFFCGLRSCEVLGLKIYDVDLELLRMKVIGKGNKERILPFPEKLGAVIRRYLRYERPLKTGATRLFVVLQGAHFGQPMSAAGLRTIFRYKRHVSGVRRANAHIWRHSFGTNMARQGVGLPVLQKMMGHSNFKMTLRYINLAMEDVAAEYEKAITNIEKRYS